MPASFRLSRSVVTIEQVDKNRTTREQIERKTKESYAHGKKVLRESSFIVPGIFHNLLTPVTSVHSYNTRNSTKLNSYLPKLRTNIGKFTFKYSATVTWETVSLTLKHLQSSSQFKKLYRAHLVSSQSNNKNFNN